MMKEQPIGLSAAEERKMESRNDYTRKSVDASLDSGVCDT